MRILKNCTRPKQTTDDLREKLDYIKDTNKTLDKFIYCRDCSKENTFQDMMFVKKLHKNYGGRQFLHYIFSFKADDPTTPEECMRFGINLSKFFSGYQVCVCTHLDTDNLHLHTIVNSVHPESGRKVRFGPQQFYELWQYAYDLYGEMHLPPDITDERMQYWLKRFKSPIDFYTGNGEDEIDHNEYNLSLKYIQPEFEPVYILNSDIVVTSEGFIRPIVYDV